MANNSNNNIVVQLLFNVQQSSLDALRAIEGQISTLTSGFNGLKNTLMGLTAGYASFEGIKNSMQSLIDTGSKFENLGIQMQAVMGGVKEGEAATKWIIDFAKNTPLQVDQTTRAFIALKNFGIDPTNGTMQALVDVTSKYGGGAEKLDRIVLGLGQAWTKAKLQGQDIMQLTEAGIPVWDLLAKQLHKTTAEVQDMAEKGKLGRDEIQLLISAIGESSKGAASSMMQSWAGLTSNLSDTWDLFLKKISDNGLLDSAKKAIQGILDALTDLDNSGELSKIAQNVGVFYSAVVKVFTELVTIVVSNASAIGNGFKAVGEAITSVTGTIGQLKPQLNALQDIASTVFSGITKVVNETITVFQAYWKEVSQGQSYTQFLEAIGSALQVILGKANDLKSGLDVLFSTLTGSATNSSEIIGTTLGKTFNSLADIATIFVNGFIAGLGALQAAFYHVASLWDEILQDVSNGVAKVAEGFAAISFGDLKERFTDMATTATNVADAFGSAVKINSDKSEKALQSVEVAAKKVVEGFKEVAEVSVQSTDAIVQVPKIYRDISKATGVVVTSQIELNEALKSGTIVFVEDTKKFISATEAKTKAINDQISAQTTATSAMYQSYRDSVQLVDEQEKKALEDLKLLGVGQEEYTQKTTAIQVKAYADRLSLHQKYVDDRLALDKKTEDLEVEKAKLQDTDITAVYKKHLENRKSLLQDLEGAYKTSTAKLIDLAKQHSDKVIEFDNRIASMKRANADALLEIDRAGMSDFEVSESRRLEILNKTSEAKALLAKGDFKGAEEVSKQIVDLAKQEATNTAAAYKAGKADYAEVLISKSKFVDAQNLSLQIVGAQKKAEEDQSTSATKLYKSQMESLSLVQNALGKITETITNLPQDKNVKVSVTKPNKENLDSVNASINTIPSSKEVKVEVPKPTEDVTETKLLLGTIPKKEKVVISVPPPVADVDNVLSELGRIPPTKTVVVQVQYQGGQPPSQQQQAAPAPESAPQEVQANNAGGLIYRNAGGFIPRKDLVPGQGDTDTVPAMLTPGEFVVRKSSVEKYGAGFMRELNKGRVPAFSKGGNVPQYLSEGGPVNEYMAASDGFIPAQGSYKYDLAFVSVLGKQHKIINMYDPIPMEVSIPQAKIVSEQNQAMLANNERLNDSAHKEYDLAYRAYQAASSLEDKVKYLTKMKEAKGKFDLTPRKFFDTYKNYGFLYGEETNNMRGLEQAAKDASSYQQGIRDDITHMEQELSALQQRIQQEQATARNDEYIASKVKESLDASKFATGGDVFIQKQPLWGKSNGRVPAMLTPGEFIIRKDIVEKYGLDALNKINQGALPTSIQKFALGGFVTEEERARQYAMAQAALTKLQSTKAPTTYSAALEAVSSFHDSFQDKGVTPYVSKIGTVPSIEDILGGYTSSGVRSVKSQSLTSKIESAISSSSIGPSNAVTNNLEAITRFNTLVAKNYDFGLSSLSGKLGATSFSNLSSNNTSQSMEVRFASPTGASVSGRFGPSDAAQLMRILHEAGAVTM